MTPLDWQPRVYLDANPIVYFVEGAPEVLGSVRPLFDFFKGQPDVAMTSEITLAEVLAPTKRPGALPPHIKRRPYFDLLVAAGFVELVPISRDVLYETVALREMTPLKLVDAIHLATAILHRCRYFVSQDADFQRMPEGMMLIRPDSNGIERIVTGLT